MKTILRMHPLPWDYRTDQLSEGYSTIIYDADGHRPILDHLREDEALDIVTAVNAHEALKDALQAIVDWANFAQQHPEEFNAHGVKNLQGPAFDKAEAALKLARAET